MKAALQEHPAGPLLLSNIRYIRIVNIKIIYGFVAYKYLYPF
ncbi:hypothetical protein SAMN05443550_11176 [Pedobacter hartonius]|uniref:Uncharacterized protein n=1 Tax=Pedobacter hartonius TaxID=425514 RepID=A0A1H4GVA7_9SPHI|nr:hypothetical protein SAMN05443550_11176 [Pedobacter hartonius]